VQTWHDGGTYMSGPAINTRIGNIDADPELEILVSGLARGPLYSFNHNGSLVPGWPASYYDRAYYPSLGNLSLGVPGLQVFTPQYMYRTPEIPPAPLLAYSGNGVMLPGWPKISANDVYEAPSLVDVDGDYIDEIFIYEMDFNLHAYRADGTPLVGWPVAATEATVAIADLDGDGDFEIVTSINSTSQGADLVVYHHDGTRMDDFMLHYYPYRHPFPVIGDVDGDGSNEIVVFSHIEEDPYFGLYVIGNSGAIENFIPLGSLNSIHGEPSAAPALADMDEDGIPEIIIGCATGILVLNADGTSIQGFPVNWDSPSMYQIGNNAPAVGDVDGDHHPDIVVANQRSGMTDGSVRVYNWHGELNPHFPKILEIDGGGGSAVADLDLDGRNEIIILGNFWNGYPGYYDKIWVYDLGGPQHGKVEWGQLGGGPQNWGSYPLPPTEPGIDLFVVPSRMVGADPGQQVDFNIQYGNSGVLQATAVEITATFSTGLSYISNSLGITPTIISQTVNWLLPDMNYLYDHDFNVTTQLPLDANYGDRYEVLIEITGEPMEANPVNNLGKVTISVSKMSFLSIIKR
jgi:uncharacterized repeat protein (TIGR01451 family)